MFDGSLLEEAVFGSTFINNMPSNPCDACKKEITKEIFKCIGCDEIYHEACLTQEEVLTIENKTEICCDDCAGIQTRLAKRKSQKDLGNGSNTEDVTFAERAMDYFEKQSCYKLPEVIDTGTSWATFYDAFVSTYSKFSVQQNIVRIQDAIKHEKVKSIGGKGLFLPQTYISCLKFINERLKGNLNTVANDAQEIMKQPRLKVEQNTQIIDYIDKVRNFNCLAVAFKDISFTSNKMFINDIAEKMPSYIKNKWIDKQLELESSETPVRLAHLIDILDKELPKLELRLRNEKLTHFTESKTNKTTKPEKSRFNNTNTDSSDDTRRDGNEKYDGKYCWYHKSSSHPSNKCRDLWQMDGKTVADLARKSFRCSYCGQKKHDVSPCPFSKKLICRTKMCGKNHHELYCFKRKIIKKNEVKNNVHRDRPAHHSRQSDIPETSSNNNTRNHSESFSEEAKSTEDARINYLRNAGLYSNMPGRIFHFSDVSHSESFTSFRPLNHNSNDSQSSPNILGVLVLRLENHRHAAFLVDSGSTVSLIEEKLANDLKLQGPWFPLELRWSGNQKRRDGGSRVVKVSVSSKNSDYKKNYSVFFRTMLDLKISPQRFIANEFYSKYAYLRDMHLLDYNEISGVIGIDNLWVFAQTKIFKSNAGKKNLPIGIRCPLGDYMLGNTCSLEAIYNDLNDREGTANEIHNNNHILLSEAEIKELQEMESEVLGMEYDMPKENDRGIHEDQIALNQLENDVRQIDGSYHYEAPLLWRYENIKLPTDESYKVALRRYMIIEKHATKMNRFDECVTQIKNLLDKNYARELTEEEIKTTSNKSYYNPIFFIFPKNKRMRMIWDLAAKVEGKSINDHLVAGPNLYNSLLQIVFQMCEQRYLFKGDLMEMFHQIRIKEEDTEALRFLFRFPGESKIRVFKMLVLPFGAKCSPTISQFVKNIIARRYMEIFPEASDIILNSTYVDDVISSNDCLEKAKQLPLETKNILEKGGFTLLKLNSNEKQIMDYLKSSLSEEHKVQEKLFSTDNEEKLLGYKINFTTDMISVALSLEKLPTAIVSGQVKPTKRQVLQLLMTVYDPVGYIQFMTSKIKLVYHRLCKEKYEWDQILDDEIFIEWKKNLMSLGLCKNIEIPRFYNYHNQLVAKRQLWAFADAGKEMVCVVLYIRLLDDKNRQVGCHFIHAKTYLAPYKQKRTIPELELDAASKSCKLVDVVRPMHKFPFDEIIYATDNSAVYAWIKNELNRPSVYVKNRVDKIEALSERDQWRWLPTKFMAADYGTKESSMPEICFDNLWFIPLLFRTPENEWPRMEPNDIEQLNLHSLVSTKDVDTEVLNDTLDASRYKSYLSYIHTIQMAFRWLHTARNSFLLKKIQTFEEQKRHDKRNRALKQEIIELKKNHEAKKREIQSADFMFDACERTIIKQAQEEVYGTEIKLLRSKEELPKENRLFKISPRFDSHGILRATTRLPHNEENEINFGYDRIFPIILPKRHPLTELAILKYHVDNKHMCENNVISALLSRFYIPCIRWIVKQTIKERCAYCIKYNARPAIPMMGDLPSYRLAHHVPPFSYCIADIAGPIKVVNARNCSAKRYIFVYSCLTTRALHLELIERLDSNSTLLALQNTINLRGAPLRIVADNGRNFIGAANIITRQCEEWNKKLLGSGIISTPIEFDFGPARAPHRQGSVERMVGLVKTAIKNINNMMQNKVGHYNDFTLKAILLEVVGIMNNRPLSVKNTLDAYNEFITPNSFLLGRQNFQEVPKTVRSAKSIEKYWEDIRELTAILWEKWLKSYLPEILMREKWINKVEPLKIGDIIVTADPSIVNSWRMGRIIDAKLGSNGQVREVVIILGKKDAIKNADVSDKRKLKKLYKDESFSIVTRPALGVAKINLA